MIADALTAILLHAEAVRRRPGGIAPSAARIAENAHRIWRVLEGAGHAPDDLAVPLRDRAGDLRSA